MHSYQSSQYTNWKTNRCNSSVGSSLLYCTIKPLPKPCERCGCAIFFVMYVDCGEQYFAMSWGPDKFTLNSTVAITMAALGTWIEFPIAQWGSFKWPKLKGWQPYAFATAWLVGNPMQAPFSAANSHLQRTGLHNFCRGLAVKHGSTPWGFEAWVAVLSKWGSPTTVTNHQHSRWHNSNATKLLLQRMCLDSGSADTHGKGQNRASWYIPSHKWPTMPSPSSSECHNSVWKTDMYGKATPKRHAQYCNLRVVDTIDQPFFGKTVRKTDKIIQ